MFRILFLGDVIAKLGRHAIQQGLPDLIDEHRPDVVIANVENLSHGVGISPSSIKELQDAGVDAFTSGNHVWGNEAGTGLLDDPAYADKLVRPANMRRKDPGRGSTVFQTKNGLRIRLINLAGQLAMPADHPAENPFHTLDTLLEGTENDPKLVFVDFHAEMTSEKEALGHYADGRVTAVIGTHTHVQTSDQRILPQQTAYCTDAGRCGARDSVLGFEKNSAVERFLKGGRIPYDLPEHGEAELDGVLIDADPETGLATGIDRFRKIVVVEPKME